MPSERAIKVAEALETIFGDGESPPGATSAAAAPELTPGQAYEQQRQAAARPAGPQPLKSLDEWEALPEREQLARMGEVDELLRRGER